MNKPLLESQEGVLYFTTLALSEIPTLSSAASQSAQNSQTLQGVFEPTVHAIHQSLCALGASLPSDSGSHMLGCLHVIPQCCQKATAHAQTSANGKHTQLESTHSPPREQ